MAGLDFGDIVFLRNMSKGGVSVQQWNNLVDQYDDLSRRFEQLRDQNVALQKDKQNLQARTYQLGMQISYLANQTDTMIRSDHAWRKIADDMVRRLAAHDPKLVESLYGLKGSPEEMWKQLRDYQQDMVDKEVTRAKRENTPYVAQNPRTPISQNVAWMSDTQVAQKMDQVQNIADRDNPLPFPELMEIKRSGPSM